MATGVGRPYLSIVVPAFNEAERLVTSLPRIESYLKTQEFPWEILVVDDGSTDETARRAQELLSAGRGRVLRDAENRGKGNAVRRGALEARGRWLLITDADLSTPIEEHGKLAAAARDRDLDVVIASRGLAASRVEVRQHVLRETVGKVGNRLIRVATGLPFHDTQCGFKLLDLERTRPIFESMVVDGFAYDVELLFLCVRFGLSVEELPVVWRNAEDSKVNLFTDPLRMLLDLALIRWRFRLGRYNPTATAAD